ncbi:MAG: hypothetical protein IH609_00120 [Dehalococcoidia bacterium]|nr:hypothetical protein [Dehalococcoidia bacterium]
MPRRKLTQGDRFIRLMLELEQEQKGVELELPPRTVDPPLDVELFDPGDLSPGSHPPRN